MGGRDALIFFGCLNHDVVKTLFNLSQKYCCMSIIKPTSQRAASGNRILWTSWNTFYNQPSLISQSASAARSLNRGRLSEAATRTRVPDIWPEAHLLNEAFKHLPTVSTTDSPTVTSPKVAAPPGPNKIRQDMMHRAGFTKPRLALYLPCQSRLLFTDGSGLTRSGRPESSLLNNTGQKRWILFKKDQGPPRHFHAKTNATATPCLDQTADDEYESNWESETRYNQPHPIWNDEEVHSVQRTHFRPRGMSDRFALYFIRLLRGTFDVCTGYAFGPLSAQGWINRVVLLETVAGVPGLVGACIRHLRSLRRMERDYGWIHTLLEEAENERMHLMSALMIKNPGPLFRCIVVAGQMFFLPLFTTLYFVSGKTAHRFVGYLEEEAVKTYTHLLEELEAGHQPSLAAMRAPRVARQYWQLKDDATFTDMIFAIRADESHHRDVNHTFANMRPDEENPFEPGH
ncbi:alternative oxidase [Gregarina niphandrodes]|uniref:Alternative oxidase n=1 Tax=Gregarina niphandrodes TaxID=110365 RepID=A0A023BC06_GRENI|nr:alternative oxidase [Gregarina niphandrodes]EZG81688.1 alternative oxidase [Gregarina niphandrodes]|eukprot:XP_011134194.1 alternative oxidase [Gregarina niphandrodes]